MEHKGIQGTSVWCTRMRLFRILFFSGIAAMTNHTTVGISQFLTTRIDLFGHSGVVCPDGLDAAVALVGREAPGVRRRIPFRIHLR